MALARALSRSVRSAPPALHAVRQHRFASDMPVYMDVQATSQLDPRVLDAMMPYLTEQYGNPHSKTHKYGWNAEHAVEDARKHIADLIGANPKEIIFTSGATESNNLAIKGVAQFYKERKNHIVTVQTEHKCVLDSCRYLQSQGFEVTYLPVQRNGVVDIEELEAAITPQTALVSTMMVNNEIGVVQPVKEIGQICRKNKVFFHTDAAQAVGKIPVDVEDIQADLMSISGHKLYGPKGMFTWMQLCATMLTAPKHNYTNPIVPFLLFNLPFLFCFSFLLPFFFSFLFLKTILWLFLAFFFSSYHSRTILLRYWRAIRATAPPCSSCSSHQRWWPRKRASFRNPPNIPLRWPWRSMPHRTAGYGYR
eukprot:m.299750 g.299750  ORF g.299750 m.299750 type:complete len:365 (+) comp15873_c2_seq1:257-1351(+)